jgi:hypothetical protein
LLLKQIEEAKTKERRLQGKKMFFCHAMPVNSAGISSLPKRKRETQEREKKNIFLVIV